MPGTSHPPRGKDTPEALLAERGAAYRRAAKYVLAESQLQGLELRAERDGYASLHPVEVLHHEAEIVHQGAPRHENQTVYRQRDEDGGWTAISRDEALRLLAEERDGQGTDRPLVHRGEPDTRRQLERR